MSQQFRVCLHCARCWAIADLHVPGGEIFGHGWYKEFFVFNKFAVSSIIALIEVFFFSSIRRMTVRLPIIFCTLQSTDFYISQSWLTLLDFLFSPFSTPLGLTLAISPPINTLTISSTTKRLDGNMLLRLSLLLSHLQASVRPPFFKFLTNLANKYSLLSCVWSDRYSREAHSEE
jgi:hypothetical protein